MEAKKSNGFKGIVAAAVIAAFTGGTGGCANTLEGVKKDLGAISPPSEQTIVSKLKEETRDYDSKTADGKRAVQDTVYKMVFQNADSCTFAWNTMVTRANGQLSYIGAIEVPEKKMGRVELHPNQVKMLVDGYEQGSNVTEGPFKGKVRVEYNQAGTQGAYHDTARFDKDTFSKDDLVKTAMLAGESFRGTGGDYFGPNGSRAKNVWHNVGVVATMGALYVREVTSNVDPQLKKLDPKYRGPVPVGDGISLLALTDGSNANLERVGTGQPGGFQLYCKGPAKK